MQFRSLLALLAVIAVGMTSNAMAEVRFSYGPMMYSSTTAYVQTEIYNDGGPEYPEVRIVCEALDARGRVITKTEGSVGPFSPNTYSKDVYAFQYRPGMKAARCGAYYDYIGS